MDSRKKLRRDGAKERIWRERIERQLRDGGSVRAFCRENGVSEASFYFWRSEIARRDLQVADRPTRSAAQAVSGSVESPTFAPVELIDTTDDSRCGERKSSDSDIATDSIEILLTDGLIVRAGERVSTDRIVDIVRAIEVRAC